MSIIIGTETLTLPDGTEVDVQLGIGLSVTAVRPPASPPPPVSPLLTDLEAWYRNDGTDHSGNSRTASPVGSGATTTNGIDGTPGAAMLFDGTGALDTAAAIVTSGSFSFAAWIKRTSANGSVPVTISQMDGGGPPNVRPVLQADSTNTRWGVQSTLGAFTGALGSGAAQDAWAHLVGTYDGTTLRLYRDGAEAATATQTVDPSTMTKFRLSGFGAIQFAGVWARKLDQSDVDALYASGAGFDPTA